MTGGSRLRWIMLVIGLAIAAVLSFVAVILTLPNVVPGTKRAMLVDMPVATSPSALAAAAGIAFALDQEPETLAKVDRLATAALLKDPLEVSAVRSLSFVRAYEDKPEEAMRLLRYGESLSRRDLMTELALALEAQRTIGNSDALRHYGHALSTTRRGYDLIVSQVIAAANDAQFARDLGSAMAARPIWRDRFLPLFIVRNENPQALGQVASGLWASGVPPDDRAVAASVTRQLLRLGAQDDAARLIAATSGDGKGAILRNGDFESRDARAPGWEYRSGASLSALPVPEEDKKGRVLEVRAGSGHLGQVARQIVAMPAGSYTLSAALGANKQADAGMPRIVVTCAGPNTQIAQLRRAEAGTVPDGMAVTTGFTVSADCPVQYVDVEFGSSVFVTDSRGTVDDIVIRRRD